MQQGVKQKHTSQGDQISSGILKILVLFMASLVVNCSFSGKKEESQLSPLKAGDYFGGKSAAFWAPKSYVPGEIIEKSARVSESPGGAD